MAFNIFVDDVRRFVAREDAYEASAILNALMDAGHRVSSDMWFAYVPNAMLTPALHTECGGDILRLTVAN